jgi:hypothetical protein
MMRWLFRLGAVLVVTFGGLAPLGAASAAVTPSRPTVIPGGATVPEGNSGFTNLNIPVTLSPASTKSVTVQWQTVFIGSGSPIQATPGVDYTASSGTATFAPGQTAQTVTIPVVGDTVVETGELFVVRFHDPTNAFLGGYYGLGFGGIANDDFAPCTTPCQGGVLDFTGAFDSTNSNYGIFGPTSGLTPGAQVTVCSDQFPCQDSGLVVANDGTVPSSGAMLPKSCYTNIYVQTTTATGYPIRSVAFNSPWVGTSFCP